MGILGRVAGVLAAIFVLLSVSVGAVGATTTAADPYSVRITTDTVVRTPSPIRTHTRITITVSVTANSTEQPTGEITLTLQSKADGGKGRSTAAGPAGWTRTIPYDGGTARVVGPAFPKPGEWLVTAEFAPGSEKFRGSRDRWTFEVVDGPRDDKGPRDPKGARDESAPRDDNHASHDNDDDGGLLPEPGRTATLWLLGAGLVGSGSTAAMLLTRRRATSGV